MDDKTKRAIITAYQTGRSSIQTIARVHKVEVSQVLDLIGEGSSTTVTIPGDLISAVEAGPGADMNYGKDVPVPFTSD